MNDLSSMDGILPTPHEYNKQIHMGSQWALFMPTVVYTDIHKGSHVDRFCFRILKSIKEFEDVFGRPTNNSSAFVNEHRSFEQFRLGFEQRFDVFGGLKTGHDVFSGVL